MCWRTALVASSPLTQDIAAQVFRIRRDTFDHKGNRLFKGVVHGVTSLTAAQASPEVIARFIRQP
jgi:hypothetical protein